MILPANPEMPSSPGSNWPFASVTLAVPNMILGETALSFLGLGTLLFAVAPRQSAGAAMADVGLDPDQVLVREVDTDQGADRHPAFSLPFGPSRQPSGPRLL